MNHSTLQLPWKAKPGDTIETMQVWPWSARLVWGFFFLLTEVVIFEDVVLHGAAITTKHLFTQGLLLGTTYFAHMVWPQLKQGRIIPSALSLVLALIGGYMVFVLSAGRNSEASEQKALAARNFNQERKLLEANVAKADADRTVAAKRVAEAAAHQAKVDGEVTGACQGGVGPLCIRARSDASAAAARLAGAEKAKEKADEVYYSLYGKLSGMKAMQVEDAEIKAIAGLLAALPWVKATEAELIAWHKIGIPAGLTAFSEIALMVSAAIRKRVPITPKRSLRWPLFGRRIEREAAELAEVTEVKALPAPDQGGSGGQAAELPQQPEPKAPVPSRPAGKLSKAEAEAYVVTQLALGRELHGQDALAEHCGVSISTMSDWLRDWEERGLVRKAKVGKRNAILKGAKVGA